MSHLIGVGTYTLAEAGRLLRIRPAKISRWLQGHRIGETDYKALWNPEIQFDDGRVFLGFRDLMEVRVAAAFIARGISAIRVRSAISAARDVIGSSHPLSTNRFRTDGRKIFLHIFETDERGEERERLLDLFSKQYEFKGVIDPILHTVDFDDRGEPTLWWPVGRRRRILLDPARAFGQPIDELSSVPTAILAAAGSQMGVRDAARAYDVPIASVKRSVEFEQQLAA